MEPRVPAVALRRNARCGVGFCVRRIIEVKKCSVRALPRIGNDEFDGTPRKNTLYTG